MHEVGNKKYTTLYKAHPVSVDNRCRFLNFSPSKNTSAQFSCQKNIGSFAKSHVAQTKRGRS